MVVDKFKLSIKLIKYRDTYESKFKDGICIDYPKIVDRKGNVHGAKYFAINPTTPRLIEFSPKDVFEILYCEVKYFEL